MIKTILGEPFVINGPLVYKTGEDLYLEYLEEQDRISRLTPDYALGADLGQAADYTAISLVKRVGDVEPPYIRGETQFLLYGLERLALGTSYVDVVRHVESRLMIPDLASKPPKPGRNCDLVIDASGCGRPVFDLFVERGLEPVGITITNGLTWTCVGHRQYHVPRLDIVSETVVAIEQGVLITPSESELPLVAALREELQNIGRRTRPVTGRAEYIAYREGVHDDLVFAVSMALWWIMHRPLRRRRMATSHQG